MQLSSVLWAIILLVLSFADATPVDQSPNKFITLAVQRYKHQPNDLHPRIVARQLANGGLMRLARISGRSDPPRELLERNLMRTVLGVEGPDGLERRFNKRSLDDTIVLDKRRKPLRLPDRPKATAINNKLVAGSKAIPTGIASGSRTTANNSLPLDIHLQDTSYLATVQIGNPPSNYSVVVDTGSADFWVASENCKASGGTRRCGGRTFLGPTNSKSFVDLKTAWSIEYGSGIVNGTKIQDDVLIAGLSLPGHPFGVATLESKDFTNVPYEGIIGLAKSSLSNQQTPNPLDALVNAGLISEPVVSYKIGRSRDNNNDGEITFGGLDPSKYNSSSLVTVPNLDPDGFWTANVSDITVGGKSLGLGRRNALLDTGTTLSYFSTADAGAIHSQIPNARRQADFDGFYIIPCNTTAVVSLTIGGRPFDIDARDLSFLPLTGESFTGDCLSGLVDSDDFTGPDTWLVGDVFLKNVYFSTNLTGNSISLAKLV